MRKKRIRKILLSIILIFFVIGSLYRLSIEPSDYNKSISKYIDKANILLKDAKLGNDKGEYSNNTIIKMKNSISQAESLIEDESPDIDKLREQYKKIKEDIKKFKSSSNKNCLSKEELEKIKKDNKLFIKEIKLEDNKKVQWNVLGKKLKKIEPINLDIENDTVYEEFIKEILKDNNMKASILSFRHNEKLPLEAEIKLHNLSKEEKYLYKYNEVSNHLIFKSEIDFENDVAKFNIDEGGDWVISNVNIDVAKLDPKEVKQENESQGELLKEKEESSEKEKINEKENATKDKKEDANKSDTKSDTKQIVKDNNSKNNTRKNNENNLNTKNKSVKAKDEESSKDKYCTIEIRCNTLLNNMDRLPKGKATYVPRDGIILAPTKVKIKENENVFDVLKRVTRSKGIQMEFRNDPLYSGAYVEGINHLYEFDGGELSGWMYKVNGWFPNYGCSRYFVKNNDYISWNYTCNLGKDVGDQDYYKYNNE